MRKDQKNIPWKLTCDSHQVLPVSSLHSWLSKSSSHLQAGSVVIQTLLHGTPHFSLLSTITILQCCPHSLHLSLQVIQLGCNPTHCAPTSPSYKTATAHLNPIDAECMKHLAHIQNSSVEVGML
ncbi:hypothetical protein E2C01_037131 [Portunus trituberculatus]|uniref:Uncharacterized protein n=1 Tax=Portunus trituberculatus TaxID=210409 RepID=A0A5B7FAK5_PORTR|nr:hypothetical protein [Portunus trituberculatus]